MSRFFLCSICGMPYRNMQLSRGPLEFECLRQNTYYNATIFYVYFCGLGECLRDHNLKITKIKCIDLWEWLLVGVVIVNEHTTDSNPMNVRKLFPQQFWMFWGLMRPYFRLRCPSHREVHSWHGSNSHSKQQLLLLKVIISITFKVGKWFWFIV